MATSARTPVPDAIFFELSPNIVLGVRVVNVLTLLMVVITFILCLVQGEKNSANYLLAANTVISAFVGIVVWWQTVGAISEKSTYIRVQNELVVQRGDLGSEKFWYILVVAVVLVFQCVAVDLFIFKVTEESVASPTLGPVNSTTRIYTWASFRPTNKSLLNPLKTTPFVPVY